MIPPATILPLSLVINLPNCGYLLKGSTQTGLIGVNLTNARSPFFLKRQYFWQLICKDEIFLLFRQVCMQNAQRGSLPKVWSRYESDFLFFPG